MKTTIERKRCHLSAWKARVILGLIMIILFAATAIKAEDLGRYINMQKFEKEYAKAGDTTKGMGSVSQNASAALKPQRDELNLAALTAKIICYLLLIGLVILFIVKYLKRSMGHKRLKGGQGRQIQILESAFVSAGKTINLVKVLDRVVVVGVSQNNMNLLTEFDAGTAKQLIEAEQKLEGGGLPGFSDTINRFLKKKNLSDK